MKTFRVEAVKHKRTLIYKERAEDGLQAMRQVLRRRPAVLIVGALELSDTYHKDKWGNWTNVVEGSFVGVSDLIEANKKI